MADVLIVDDEEHNRLLLATLVRAAGHVPLEASSAEVALQLAERDRPALIVVDLSLPDMSGAQLIRRLRADPKTAAAKIALYTATRMDAAIQELSEVYGLSGVIPKPGDPHDILLMLQRLLPA